jgi:hypothetical protein
VIHASRVCEVVRARSTPGPTRSFRGRGRDLASHRCGPTAVRSRLAELACVALLIGYVAVVIVPASCNPNTNGFAAYYTVSRILREEPGALARAYDNAWFQTRIDRFGFDHVKDIFSGQPPTACLVLSPIARLSPPRARMLWVWLGLLWWLGGLAALAWSLDMPRGPTRVEPVLLLGALTCADLPVAENFHQGQLYLLMFFLLCLHIALMIRDGNEDRLKAGIPLGLMVILKGAGAWWLLLLLLSRRWWTAFAALITGFVVALASLPLVGGSAWWIFLRGLSRLGADPVWHVTAYQTVASLTGHLLVPDAQWNPAAVARSPRVAAALTLAITISAAAVSVRRQRLASEDRQLRVLSLAMFGALVASLAPVAESYHYVLVLPAVVVAWWWALAMSAGLRSRLMLALATILLNVPHVVYGAPALRDGWRALLAYPRLYGAFALWAWLVGALATVRTSGGEAVTTIA